MRSTNIPHTELTRTALWHGIIGMVEVYEGAPVAVECGPQEVWRVSPLTGTSLMLAPSILYVHNVLQINIRVKKDEA